MGMDVYGRKPSSKDGEYFRANIWSWRPIHAICNRVNETDGLKLKMNGWQFNDGAGLKSQKQCDRLADSIQKFVENDIGDDGMFKTNVDISNLPEYFLLALVNPQAAENKNQSYQYRVNKEHLLEFVKFLRSCGGFEIC